MTLKSLFIQLKRVSKVLSFLFIPYYVKKQRHYNKHNIVHLL